MHLPAPRPKVVSSLPLSQQREYLWAELTEFERSLPQVGVVLADRTRAQAETGDWRTSWFDTTMCREIWVPHNVIGPRGLRYFCGMNRRGDILSIGSGEGSQAYQTRAGYDVRTNSLQDREHTDWSILDARLLAPPTGRLDVSLTLGRRALTVVGQETELRFQSPSMNCATLTEGDEAAVYDPMALRNVYQAMKHLSETYGSLLEELYLPDAEVIELAA